MLIQAQICWDSFLGKIDTYRRIVTYCICIMEQCFYYADNFNKIPDSKLSDIKFSAK